MWHSPDGSMYGTNREETPRSEVEKTEFSELRMEKLLEAMEDDDDVQNVWHNWDQD